MELFLWRELDALHDHFVFNCFMNMYCLRVVSAPKIFGLLCSPISYPIPAIFNWRLYNGSATTMIEPFERVVIDS